MNVLMNIIIPKNKTMEITADYSIPLYPLIHEQVPSGATNVLATLPPDSIRTATERYTWEQVAEITGIDAGVDTIRQRRWDKVTDVVPYPLKDDIGISLEGAWLLCSVQAWCYDERGPMLSHKLWGARYREVYEGKRDPKAPKPVAAVHSAPTMRYADDSEPLALEVYRPALAVVPPSPGLSIDLDDLRSNLVGAIQATLMAGDEDLIQMAKLQGAELGARMKVAKTNEALRVYTDLGQGQPQQTQAPQESQESKAS